MHRVRVRVRGGEHAAEHAAAGGVQVCRLARYRFAGLQGTGFHCYLGTFSCVQVRESTRLIMKMWRLRDQK